MGLTLSDNVTSLDIGNGVVLVRLRQETKARSLHRQPFSLQLEHKALPRETTVQICVPRRTMNSIVMLGGMRDKET